MGNITAVCCSQNCVRIIIIGDSKKKIEFYCHITANEVSFQSCFHHESQVPINGVNTSIVLPDSFPKVWACQVKSADAFVFVSDGNIDGFEEFCKGGEYYKLPKLLVIIDNKNEIDLPEKSPYLKICKYDFEDKNEISEGLRWLVTEVNSQK